MRKEPNPPPPTFVKGRIMEIKLGQKVRDTISGFEGIAVCRSEWLYGCVRISVAGKIDKDGKVPDTQTFDEPQLEVMTPAKPIGFVAEPPAGLRPDPGQKPDPTR